MEIIDKGGYLESALRYIERNIVSGKGLHKIARKSGVSEDLLKNLNLALKNFSEKQFFTALHEAVEESHSSLSGAVAEVSAADISIETRKNKAFICMGLTFNIIYDDEIEDQLNFDVKIFSKNNIQIA